MWRVGCWLGTALLLGSVSSSIGAAAQCPAQGTQAPPHPAYFERGINLAGAEFGADKLPGLHATDYTYPPPESLDYYAGKGFSVVRLPFLWERVQPQLFGDLNREEIARIRRVLDDASGRGLKVILTPHNYGRYTIEGKPAAIGSKQVPISAFADFWRHFAREFADAPAIYGFSLMNEPHAMQGVWKRAAQAGVDAIRRHDSAHYILAPGDEWSGAWRWKDFNRDFLLKDPAGKLIYEAHQYFDGDKSGTYKDVNGQAMPIDPDLGVRLVQPFLEWLREHRVSGIVTEFGVPAGEPRWFPVVERFLARLACDNVPWTYWAGGPWWGEYKLSIEPRDGADAPLMAVLTRDYPRN